MRIVGWVMDIWSGELLGNRDGMIRDGLRICVTIFGKKNGGMEGGVQESIILYPLNAKSSNSIRATKLCTNTPSQSQFPPPTIPSNNLRPIFPPINDQFLNTHPHPHPIVKPSKPFLNNPFPPPIPRDQHFT